MFSPAVVVDAADVVLDVVVFDQLDFPIPPLVSSDPHVPDDDAQLSGVKGEILGQIKSL